MNWPDENGTNGLVKPNTRFNPCVCIVTTDSKFIETILLIQVPVHALPYANFYTPCRCMTGEL